jgi:NAD(P)H-dependent FMN reductase
MANKPKILCFAGSLRRDSFNKKLVQIGRKFVEEAGGDATYVDLREFDMPLYDQDLEDKQGLPAGVRKFKSLMLEHQGLLISAPEYNSSISAALKNAIDWASRPEPGEAPLACFNGKVAGLLAASPGVFGGLRGLFAVRYILSNIKVIVLPDQFALPQANAAFDEQGALKDAKHAAAVRGVAERLVRITAAITAV